MVDTQGGSGRLRASVARGGSIAVVGAVSSTVGGFLLVFAAARLLGPVDTGRLFAAIALFAVVINAAKLGADTSLVRFVAQLRARDNDQAIPALLRLALPAVLVVSCAVTVVMLVGAPTISSLLYTDGLAPGGVVLIRELAWFVPPATITLALLGAHRGYGTVSAFVAVEQVFKPLSRPVLVTVAVLVGGGGALALGAWLAPVAVGLVVSVLAVRRQLRTHLETGSVPAAAVSAGEFWRFAIPRAFSGFLEIVAPWTAVLLLSGMSGSADAASFTALSRVAMAGTMVMVALRLAMAPYLSAAFSVGDTDTVSSLHRHSTVIAIVASWPFFVAIAVFARPVLEIFGSEFSDGAWALVFVAAGNLLNVAVGNVQTVILMGGRSTWNLIDTGAAVVTQVVLGLVLIPPLGVTGAGLAYMAGIVVNNLTALLQVVLGLRIRVWSRASSAACVLTAGFVGAVSVGCRWLIGDSLLALAVAVCVSVAGGVLVVLRRPDILDLRESVEMLRGRAAPARSRGER